MLNERFRERFKSDDAMQRMMMSVYALGRYSVNRENISEITDALEDADSSIFAGLRLKLFRIWAGAAGTLSSAAHAQAL